MQSIITSATRYYLQTDKANQVCKISKNIHGKHVFQWCMPYCQFFLLVAPMGRWCGHR